MSERVVSSESGESNFRNDLEEFNVHCDLELTVFHPLTEMVLTRTPVTRSGQDPLGAIKSRPLLDSVATNTRTHQPDGFQSLGDRGTEWNRQVLNTAANTSAGVNQNGAAAAAAGVPKGFRVVEDLSHLCAAAAPSNVAPPNAATAATLGRVNFKKIRP